MASVSSSFQPYRTDTQSNKLYLYFWHTYSPVMYSLYEIDVPNPLPPPPTKDVQDEQILNPNHLAPILELKTGEYPGNMCCVSLGSKLYFMGGEYDIDYPCIGAGVKINYKNDFFPRDVYIFDPTKSSSLLDGTAMNSGKSWPWAFVADEKIYVLGSNFTTDIFDKSWRKDSELKSLSLFEVYHPKDDKWTILPNPPLDNVETRWAGHAVKRRKVFFIARQRGIERLYCFDLERDQWTKGIALPSNLRNVSGRIEVIEGTLYGCYLNTIAAIAPVAEEEDEGEEREQEMEEGEEEERVEWEEEDELNIQQQQEEDEMGAWFRNYGFHVVSREMGMEAIFNVPQQLQSSSTLLHLGSRCFCYIKTGMPPHPKYGRDHAIEDDKVRVISIVIFRALGETYKEGATRFFRAKFLHSAHYAVKTLFPNEGVIHGCFSLGWVQPLPQNVIPGANSAGGANQFVTTCLYVGDLEQSVTDTQLYDLFNQLGGVVSIRVCRDLSTRRSLGYGYVNYSNPQDAARALDVLNFTPLNGKPIRIMHSHRGPSIHKIGAGDIFIKNLDKAIDCKALHDTFSAFGNILSCNVVTDSSGQSQGYGFVQFDNGEAAQKAIEKLNGMLLNDKQVFVGPLLLKQERETTIDKTRFNNVVVKNLSEVTTEKDLNRIFGEFGTLTSFVVMRDADGKSKCFGFINFENADDAARAVESLNGKKVDDKEWYVGHVQQQQAGNAADQLASLSLGDNLVS